jgi:hypothetical protein
MGGSDLEQNATWCDVSGNAGYRKSIMKMARYVKGGYQRAL